MAEKPKDSSQNIKELEDDKPDYQEKITFLVSTVAQEFILTWCLRLIALLQNNEKITSIIIISNNTCLR